MAYIRQDATVYSGECRGQAASEVQQMLSCVYPVVRDRNFEGDPIYGGGGRNTTKRMLICVCPAGREIIVLYSLLFTPLLSRQTRKKDEKKTKRTRKKDEKNSKKGRKKHEKNTKTIRDASELLTENCCDRILLSRPSPRFTLGLFFRSSPFGLQFCHSDLTYFTKIT